MDIICKGIDWQQAPPGGWGLNFWILKRPFDAIFDFHNIPLLVEAGTRPREKTNRMFRRVEKLGIPLYSLEAWPGTPCIRYPIEKVREFFKIDYFGSSVDYMLALAIFQGEKEINLWGAHFARGTEYEHQRPSAQFWIGVALGMGVDIKIMTKTTMFNLKEMYGYLKEPALTNNFIGAHL